MMAKAKRSRCRRKDHACRAAQAARAGKCALAFDTFKKTSYSRNKADNNAKLRSALHTIQTFCGYDRRREWVPRPAFPRVREERRLRKAFLNSPMFSVFKSHPRMLRVEVPQPGVARVIIDRFKSLNIADFRPVRVEAFTLPAEGIKGGSLTSGNHKGVEMQFNYTYPGD